MTSALDGRILDNQLRTISTTRHAAETRGRPPNLDGGFVADSRRTMARRWPRRPPAAP
jgi:hypothetical protein